MAQRDPAREMTARASRQGPLDSPHAPDTPFAARTRRARRIFDALRASRAAHSSDASHAHPAPRASRVSRAERVRLRASSVARLVAATAFATVLALLGACSHEPPRKPDVILIVIDTLRADRLGSHGYPRPTSPVLDELARDGTLFTDCTSQSGWTRPSVVSLLQGRYFTAYRDTLDPDHACLAERFQQAGYRTIGASANLLLKAQYGFDRGFYSYDDRRANREPDARTSLPRAFEQLCDELWPRLDVPQPDERAPLFLYVQPFDPHAPYVEHADLEDELPSRDAGVPFDAVWHRAELERIGFAATEVDPTGERALRYMRYQRGVYDQEVRYTDAWLGRLLDGLRARGYLEHAIVAIVADHGEGLWDHVAWAEPQKLAASPPQALFYQQHGAHLYQEAIHTPFVLHGDGVARGVRIDAAIENVDLFPTLLELANLPLPDDLHGRSVLPLARREAEQRRPFVYSSVLLGDCVREVDSALKLIEPSALGRKFRAEPELYDLRADPLERVNLAAQRPADVARLSAALREWRERYPTQSQLDAAKSAEELQLMRDLGYTSQQHGR